MEIMGQWNYYKQLQERQLAHDNKYTEWVMVGFLVRIGERIDNLNIFYITARFAKIQIIFLFLV